MNRPYNSISNLLITLIIVIPLCLSCDANRFKLYEGQTVRSISNDLVAKIKSGQYKTVEDYLDYLVLEKPYSVNGTRLLEEIYEDLSHRRKILNHYDQWCQSKKLHSSAYLIRGKYHLAKAWRIRRSGFINRNPDERTDKFSEHLILAKNDLEISYFLNPQDPNSASAMIEICQGLQLDEKTMNTWFDRAVIADPVTFNPYLRKLNYFYSTTEASVKKQREFAEFSFKSPPSKSIVHTIMLHFLLKEANRSSDKRTFLNKKSARRIIGNIFDKWLADFPNSPSALSRKGDIYLLRGKKAEALSLFNQALEIDPDNLFALHMRANWYMDTGSESEENLKMAQKDYLKIISIYPHDGEAFYELAFIAKHLYLDHKKAIQYYNKAISINSGEKKYYTGRGLAKSSIEDYASALTDFKAALQLDPNYIAGYYNLGLCLQKMKRYKESKEAFKLARELMMNEKTGGSPDLENSFDLKQ